MDAINFHLQVETQRAVAGIFGVFRRAVVSFVSSCQPRHVVADRDPSWPRIRGRRVLILHRSQKTPAIIGISDDSIFHGFVARALQMGQSR